MNKDRPDLCNDIFMSPSNDPPFLYCNLNHLALPSVRDSHGGCARGWHRISMIGILLPCHRAVTCNIDVFVLNHLSSRELNGHKPEVVA
jgi:hypothetical protein